MPAPDILFQVDASQVIAAAKKLNDLDRQLAQGTEVAAESIRGTLSSASEALIKMGDRGSQALDKITAGVQRQAAAYGQPEWKRAELQRDAMISKWNGESESIKRLTDSFAPLIAKMRDAEQVAARAESAGAGGSGFNARYAIFGLKDIAENRTKYAVIELFNELTRLTGTAALIGGVAAGVAGIGVAAVAAQRHMADLREEPARLAAEFARMGASDRLANQELAVTNDKLENSIAKLEGRPQNGIKLAIDEAAASADRLAERLDKSLKTFYDLAKQSQHGIFDQMFFRGTNDKDISEQIGGRSGMGGMRGELYAITSAGLDPTAALGRYQAETQQKLAIAQNSQAFQQGKPYRRDLGPIETSADQSSRIEVLKALSADIDQKQKSYADERKHDSLVYEQNFAQSAKDASKALDEFTKRMDTFGREMANKEVNPIARLNIQRDQLLDSAPGGATQTQIEQANIFAISGAQGILAKQAEKMQTEAGNNLRREMAENDRQGLERAHRQWEEQMRPLNRQDEERMRALERVDSINTSSEREMMERHAGKLAGAAGSPEEAYRIRVNYANQIADIEAARIKREDDANKRMIETAEARKDYFNQLSRAEDELAQKQQAAAVKLAEEQQKRIDSIAHTASGLWEGLLTHPSRFPQQLAHTAQSAITKHASDYLGGLTANMLGPIFGSHEAVKVGGVPAVHVVNWPSAGSPMGAPWGGFSGTVPGGFSTIFMGGGGGYSSAGGTTSGTAASFATPNLNMSYTPIPGGGGGDFGMSSPAADIRNLPQNDSSWKNMIPGMTKGTAGSGALLGGGAIAGLHSMSDVAGLVYNRWAPISMGPGSATTPAGIGGIGGGLAAFGMSPAAGIIGGLGAQYGLLGGGRGTALGTATAGLGGAMLGFQAGASIGSLGGPAGAAIGAGVGILAGAAEMLAGVEPQWREAERLVKQSYGIGINQAEGQKIADLANNQFGGRVSIAVTSPTVRQMLGLFAAGSGQAGNYKMPISQPYGASLVESGGRLQQQAISQYGNNYTYQSSLPVYGGNGGQTLSSSTGNIGGNTYLSVTVPNSGLAQFMTGNYVTADFVNSQYSASLSSSNGRTSDAMTFNEPGTIVA